MTNIHLASDGQTSQQKPLVYVGWDIQNVKFKSKELLSFASNLLDFTSSKGLLDCPRVYYNSRHKNQVSAKNNLDSLGFNCIDVPCPLKNSADNQLIADCISRVALKPSPNIIILVLGDKDFAGLICVLRSLRKKVIIFAQRGSGSQKLIKIADEFYYVDELPKLVSNKTEPQPNYVLPQFHYQDAIECLIEAINTALSEGKRTDFSYIGQLMRRSSRFPSCNKFPSVCKPDGTAVSCFSKLIAAAVADGKIRMQNQELFLIEENGLAP